MRRSPLTALASIFLISGFIVGLVVLSCGGLWIMALAWSSWKPLAISPDQFPDAQTGQAYSASLQVSRTDTPAYEISVAAGALPPGLTLSHKRGENAATISGLPASPGNYSFTIRVSCYGTMVAGQSGQQSYTLVVK